MGRIVYVRRNTGVLHMRQYTPSDSLHIATNVLYGSMLLLDGVVFYSLGAVATWFSINRSAGVMWFCVFVVLSAVMSAEYYSAGRRSDGQRGEIRYRVHHVVVLNLVAFGYVAVIAASMCPFSAYRYSLAISLTVVWAISPIVIRRSLLFASS